MHRPARLMATCLAGLIAAAALHVVPAAAAPAPVSEAQAQQIGSDAYVYGVALMEFLRQAKQQTSVTVPDGRGDAPVNQLGSARNLTTAKNQVVIAPNNDTPYTMAHLDLGGGPLVLHVPAIPDHRYYTFEFLDPYTNVFHYVGTRTTGDGAGNYAIVGPGFKGKLPAGVHRINSAYERVWLLGRTLDYGTGDLSEVHKIQDGYKLIPLRAFERVGLNYTPPRPQKIITQTTPATVPAGLAFFDSLGTALAENPPPARDSAILHELAKVGIGPGLHPSSEHLPAATLAGLKAAAANGPATVYSQRVKLVLASAPKHNGWYVAPSDIGAYGTDYDLRAVVAVYAIGANLPVEAMYPVGSFDSTGALLNGANSYVIHFAKSQLPPAKYFWSLTAYDQNLFLVSNPINRYSLGNRSSLKYNNDGSLDIYVQSTPPAGHMSNWLPGPASGQLEVIMRLYGPGRSAIDGTYQYPAITKVS